MYIGERHLPQIITLNKKQKRTSWGDVQGLSITYLEILKKAPEAAHRSLFLTPVKSHFYTFFRRFSPHFYTFFRVLL